MKMIRNALLSLATLLPVASPAQSSRYTEGQVWAYRTRPADNGALLKIQRIEVLNGRTIYHLSLIGLHLGTSGFIGVVQHEPVSQETLDKSVTELRPDPGTFPSADEGIAEWRARGAACTPSRWRRR